MVLKNCCFTLEYVWWDLEEEELEYTPAIDVWSIGCIFAEVLTGKPLFPGKSVVHQLDLITDLLGTPSSETVSGVRNEKARKYLMEMRKKYPIPFAQKFPNIDPSTLRLLQRLLAFDPKDRPPAEEVKEACKRASEAEELAQNCLSEMNFHLNAHCRITCTERPRVKFANYVEEKIYTKSASPNK